MQIFLIILAIILFPTIVFLVDKYNPKKYKGLILIGLWSFIAVFLYMTIMSIYGEMKFNQEKEKRYKIVIENLKDIRDVGILYRESLEKSYINFIPFVAKIGNLSSYYGHTTFDAKSMHVSNVFEKTIKETDLVNQIFINNNKIDLFLINNLT